MKNRILASVAIFGLVTLGACNKQETPQAQNVADVTDNMADNVDAMADNTSGNVNDMLENKADTMRAEGSNKAEEIDKAADNGASNATLNAMAKNATAK